MGEEGVVTAKKDGLYWFISALVNRMVGLERKEEVYKGGAVFISGPFEVTLGVVENFLVPVLVLVMANGFI